MTYLNILIRYVFSSDGFGKILLKKRLELKFQEVGDCYIEFHFSPSHTTSRFSSDIIKGK